MKMKIVGDSHPTSWERLSRKTGRASRAEDRNSHDRARIEPQRELPKAPRRFTPARKCWISRFEKRDPADYTGIRRKNRPKQFQIENDSRKRDTIPRRTRRKPSWRVYCGLLREYSAARRLSRSAFGGQANPGFGSKPPASRAQQRRIV